MKKFRVHDRVLFKRWDAYNNREDRGLGYIEKFGELGVIYYIVKFDREVNGKVSETFYDTDLQLFDDKDKRNCPKCYERMEFKLLSLEINGEQKIYQCPYCKNIESI